jgi:hypothetical protein
MRVITTTPTGKQRTTDVRKLRDAGQVVAFTLADNTGMSRRDATKLGMQFEQTGTLESNGYTFRIER